MVGCSRALTLYVWYGRPATVYGADGSETIYVYDPLTGALLKHIDDFANLPSGWVTPTGGGLELISTYQVDALGRTTLATDPNGNQTYYVYHDGHAAGSGGFVSEVRVYPGWHQIGTSGTYTTTGPVQVTREYRPAPGAGSGQQTVYDETLSFTAPVESTTSPSGTEAIDQTNIQSLSRSQTNNAGQMVEGDAYSSLAGLTYSASLALLANATPASSISPLWLTFADVRLVPAYVGQVAMLAGLRALWRARRWGVVCVLCGSLLLSVELIHYVAAVARVTWHDHEWIYQWDLNEVLMVVAAVFDIVTIVLLARRLTRISRNS